ncbi:hypothetical protein [Sphingomonas sp. CFBP 13720]|uniref:hypothetical protein n=1 Tax=Sphingomonas sp. CFBP 13720 TaxID=2775302 RepID=UPI001782C43B|nr:hypothetical protein [Sphingomonas sp. CFBP 13720]MBD8679094.1 hypothetical protein [Sphingomonas sp. CFBP 13720]
MPIMIVIARTRHRTRRIDPIVVVSALCEFFANVIPLPPTLPSPGDLARWPSNENDAGIASGIVRFDT